MISNDDVSLRGADVSDGSRIWAAIPKIASLERNSCYAYLLLSSHFASTCVVAEVGDELVGFVAAYRPPSSPLDVFVWQVGVTPSMRGRGVGHSLLAALIERPGARDAHYLTATVSPDNRPSAALFHGFARSRGVACVTVPGFPSGCFAEPHPDENLLRIGPLSTNR